MTSPYDDLRSVIAHAIWERQKAEWGFDHCEPLDPDCLETADAVIAALKREGVIE